MRYWDAMQSKWGFSDGEAVPDSIEAYRDVYLRVVNRLAEQLGSAARATAYDRAGFHNPVLITFHDATNLGGEETSIDAAMDEAIDHAHTLDVDDYVIVSVIVDPSFDLLLAALQPQEEGEEL